MKLDRVAAEAQILVEEFPQVKDHPGYANCIYFQIQSYWKRRDESQFIKALEAHRQINLSKATNKDNALLTLIYMDILSFCFGMQLYEEGFQIITKINQIHLTPQELNQFKSYNNYKEWCSKAIKGGSTSNLLPQLEMLV